MRVDEVGGSGKADYQYLQGSELESLTTGYEPSRAEMLFLNGDRKPFEVRRIPLQHLYFNIENGRYADIMYQLRARHPDRNPDPREPEWREKILLMLQGRYREVMGGDAAGTEQDQKPFERLCSDIRERRQMRPGIVTADGGVLDGNRRLAALLTLYRTEPQPREWAHFDGVILPKSITPADRWAIEAERQLGRDEQLDYPAICKLLKVRQGMEIFGRAKLPTGRTPEQLVAKAIYGVDAGEIRENLERLALIDKYLEFYNMAEQYHRVAGTSEKFKEALANLKTAQLRGLGFEQIETLQVVQFSMIRHDVMDNWELREISKAMGGNPARPGRKSDPVPGAIEALLKDFPSPVDARIVARDGNLSDIKEKTEEAKEEFFDVVERTREKDRPIKLMRNVRSSVTTIQASFARKPLPVAYREEFLLLAQQTEKLLGDCTAAVKKMGR